MQTNELIIVHIIQGSQALLPLSYFHSYFFNGETKKKCDTLYFLGLGYRACLEQEITLFSIGKTIIVDSRDAKSY